MVMHMRKILFAIVLAAMLSAEVSVTPVFDGRLYTTYSPPDEFGHVYMRPFIQFENTLHASTTARVIYGGPATDLQHNAIICEGDVEVSSSADAEWAHGGLYQYVLYWLPCEPPSQSSVRNNIPVTWNGDYYDALYPLEQCDEGDRSCWGMEGPLVGQRVDTYEVYGGSGTRYTNKRGDTNVVCKGTSTLRSDGSILVSRVIDGSPYSGTVALRRGTHTLTNEMGASCLGVVRFPQKCTPTTQLHEKIYGRTEPRFGSSAPAYATTVGPATMNLRVVTNEDLMCRAGIASVTPSPLNVSPGGTQTATVVVNNNCPASEPLCQPITITGITVSDGFRFTYFMLPGGSYTALPGRSVSIPGSLTAPEYLDCPTRLTFTATYTCTGCEGSFSGTPVTVNVPFECPPPDLNLTNLRPRFNPDFGSRIDLRTGDELDLEIITWNNGFTPSNPGETCVNIGRFVTLIPGIGSPPVTIFDDVVAPQRHSYGAILAGGEVNHGSVDFSCTPEMENNTYTLVAVVDCMPPPFGATPEMNEEDNRETRLINCVPRETNITEDGDRYRCDITPSFQTGYPMGEYPFRVTCPSEGNPDNTCGGDISWSSHPTNVTYTAETDYDIYEIRVGGSSGPGIVDITARVRYADGNATCDAQLVVPYVPCEDFL